MTADRVKIRHGLEIEEIAGYSQGLKVGRLVYVAGQIGRDETGKPIPETGLVPKFERTIANIERVLEQLGSSLSRLVYVQLYVTEDLEGCWSNLATLHRRYFSEAKPASTIIQVDNLNHPDYLVEISAVAVTNYARDTNAGERAKGRDR